MCGVRRNEGGGLYTYAYANPVALHVDPVEKKPLYHFLPGTQTFSLAVPGCNFHCGFCQNWQISQIKFGRAQHIAADEVAPEAVVENALHTNCNSISYTYTEPTIFFEYALDIARGAKEKGLANIFVTNGYMTKQALEMIRPFLDAANVDLKFFRDESYRRVCGARLEPVLETIRLMRAMGIWVEVTTLIVPRENDSDEELTSIAKFLAGIDKDMPWHVSRFHPDYKFMDRNATAESVVKKSCGIGEDAGLRYVYAGNVGGWGSDTRCHSCGNVVIKREGFSVLEYNMKESACASCGAILQGVFMREI